MNSNFEFVIGSASLGDFTATAPLKFSREINRFTWFIRVDKKRRAGVQIEARANSVGQDGKRTTLSLHRLVWRLLGRPETPEIDHVDGNPLNNSEHNIRAATHLQNTRNLHKRRHNTTGYKGVTMNKRTGRFVAQTKLLGKHIQIGCFPDPVAAAMAYDEYVKANFGAFAKTNAELGYLGG